MNKPVTQTPSEIAADLATQKNMASLLDFMSKTLRLSMGEAGKVCLSLGVQLRYANIDKRPDIDLQLLSDYQFMSELAYKAFDAHAHLREPS